MGIIKIYLQIINKIFIVLEEVLKFKNIIFVDP